MRTGARRLIMPERRAVKVSLLQHIHYIIHLQYNVRSNGIAFKSTTNYSTHCVLPSGFIYPSSDLKSNGPKETATLYILLRFVSVERIHAISVYRYIWQLLVIVFLIYIAWSHILILYIILAYIILYIYISSTIYFPHCLLRTLLSTFYSIRLVLCFSMCDI